MNFHARAVAQPHPLVALIDQAMELAADKSFRGHMGGSMIGRACDREIWYGFRHARRPSFPGRILRLFGRGHLEEPRFVTYLKMVGAEVQEYSQQLWFNDVTFEYIALDWEHDTSGGMGAFMPVTDQPFHVMEAKRRGVELKQWRILDVDGHFGGSLDGKVKNVPLYEGRRLLVEFKTHGDNSFKKLLAEYAKDRGGYFEGVRWAKPEHYSQMQVYMHKTGLDGALYFAVNKNDDHMHIEYVPYDQTEALRCIARAHRLVHAPQPPARIGTGRASFHECKFCDFKGICHEGEPMLKGCRTCRFSKPAEGGTWYCNQWQSTIPRNAIEAGCDRYMTIHD